MKPEGLSVVIAGGGTGGHLYPGVAVARALTARRPDARVSFVGTARGIEARVVPAEGFPLDTIRSQGLKGKSLASRLSGAAVLPLSFIDAWRVLSRRRPHVVVGVGGYSSGPVVLLAALRGSATMVLEQNAMPGLTNRTLARVVRAAAVTYESTLSWFGGKGFVAGNPVRPEFLRPGGAGTEPRRPRVLVLGGSQGAHAINVAMVEVALALRQACPDIEILHQTGERDLDLVRRGYAAQGVEAGVEPFLTGMAHEMRAATVVVSRAGATTLAELAALGVPAVLVPFPGAADDHQRKNAEVLAAAGAAVLIDQASLSTPEGRQVLVDAVARVVTSADVREEMGRTMRGFARPDAAEVIVDRLLELAA